MILAILQARCSSRRLPNKVLKPLLGRPMVLREIERLSRSQHIDRIVLATSVDASDDGLYDAVREAGVYVYRGSLDDVLGRYYACAKEYGADHIVRVTGDCPVIDWRVTDNVIERHLAECNDYTHMTERFPEGLDTEVMTFAALERAYRAATRSSEREHVTLYFRNYPEQFHIGVVDCAEDYGDMRWTVDEPCDFALVETIYEQLYPTNNDFAMQDMLALFSEHPELQELNQSVIRNEGLQKSLAEDTEFIG